MKMKKFSAIVFISSLLPLISGASMFPPGDISENNTDTVSQSEQENSIEVKEFILPDDVELMETVDIRGNRQAEVYKEEISYTIREIKDPAIPEGKEIVVQEGSDGYTLHYDVIDSKSGYSVKENKPVEKIVRVSDFDNSSFIRIPAIEPALLTIWEEERITQEQQEEEERERERQIERENQEREAQEAQIRQQESEQTQAAENQTSNNNRSNSSSAVRANVSCGGWDELVLDNFGESEYEKACRVLMCESTGNPQAQNPVSTASGLFQFLDTTWASTRGHVGAGGYARSYQAPPELQVAAAKNLRDRYGWSQWVCQ